MKSSTQNPNDEKRKPKEIRKSKVQSGWAWRNSISDCELRDSSCRAVAPSQRVEFRNSVFGFVAAVFCLLISPFCFVAHAQTYSIDLFTIDGGGGASTGGVYSGNGTIGPPHAKPPGRTG